MGDLNYRTLSIGSAELDAVSGSRVLGRSALHFHIAFRLRAARWTGQPPIAHIAWLGGEVGTPAGTIFLRPLVQEISLHEHDCSVVLAADLDERQIRALDESRGADGSVQFTLHLRTLVHGCEGVLPVYSCCRRTVNQTDWLTLLHAATPEDRFTAEALVQRAQASESLASAASEFREARSLFERRETVAVLTACRRTLDHVLAGSGAKGLDIQWTLAERIAHVHAAVRHIMHAGPHAGIGAPGPAEARLAINLTAMLLDYANRKD